MKSKSEKKARKQGWRSRLRSWLPASDIVKKNKFVGWIGPAIYHPRLWHLNRQGVALGLSIGLFFGFLVPVFQIPFAAMFAVWLRANILVAVCSTLVSNPFTYAPIWFFAYRLGLLMSGGNPADDAVLGIEGTQEQMPYFYGLFNRFFSMGKPLVFGLSALAITAGAVGYAGVLILWRSVVLVEWHRRRFRKRTEENK